MLIKVENLSFGWQALLFDSVNCRLDEGQAVWLKGENGSGKTSFLKCLCGMIPHFERGKHLSGDVKISGHSVFENPPRFFFPQIAFINLSALDLFLFTSSLHEETVIASSFTGFEYESCLRKLIFFQEFFHLPEKWQYTPFSNMDVQDKCLALLAVFYTQQAKIYLLDEILKVFPPEKRQTWNAWLRHLKSEGACAVIASHEKPDGADCCWALSQGGLHVL